MHPEQSSRRCKIDRMLERVGVVVRTLQEGTLTFKIHNLQAGMIRLDIGINSSLLLDRQSKHSGSVHKFWSNSGKAGTNLKLRSLGLDEAEGGPIFCSACLWRQYSSLYRHRHPAHRVM